MDRRDVLKKLAVGGVTLVGGARLLTDAAIAAPDGKGRPAPPPPPPPPTGLPALTLGSPARIELLFSGGRRAKARLTLTDDARTGFHGWDAVAGNPDDGMSYEALSLEYVGAPLAGDQQCDVKARLDNGFTSGSYAFVYWHGPSDNRDGATFYDVRVHVLDRGASMTFEATARAS